MARGFLSRFLALLLIIHQVEGAAREKPKVPIVPGSNDGKSLDDFGEHSAASLESLKRSVFRISVFSKVWRWSRPFDDHYVVGSLGSGFLVGDKPLTICTCAHVVRGADRVYLQVPEFGKTKFEARVEIINNDVDVAFLSLKDPEALLQKLGEANVTLKPLRFAEKTPPLGHIVTAPGFPLGQETMTLSTGVISGVDHVSFHYTNLAIQSTAIISSGNSGSPLLDSDTMEVIGMNYAKLPSEAQINYVVALWRLKQVLLKHKQIHASGIATENYQFRLVKPGLVITPGVDALYLLSRSSTTCNTGPLISSILPNSPFQGASPKIPENSFLVSLDEVKLDKYGQGTKKEYVNYKVDFADLMWMRRGTGEEDISFETCNAATGEVQEHKMSLAWSPERNGNGIQYVYDARLDQFDWEIYGDLLFMPLTENAINLFNGDFHSAATIRFLEPGERQKPRLAVLLLKEGGEAGEALELRKGSDLEIVASINGHNVKDLEDYRRHFFPDPAAQAQTVTSDQTGSQSFLLRERQSIRKGDEVVWSLKTSAGKEYASLFVNTLKAQAEQYAAGERYILTSAAKDAMVQLDILSAPKKKSLLARAQDKTLGEMDIDPASEVRAKPLEVIRRDGNVAIVDYAQHEAYDTW